MGDGTSNTFKIVLIMVSILLLSAVVFLIGLILGSNSSDGENGGVTNNFENKTQEQRTETIKDNERETRSQTDDGTQEQTGINNVNQVSNGRERLFLGLSLNGSTTNGGNGKLKSNFSVNPDGENVVVFYDDRGIKTNEFKGTFADDGTSEGVIIIYDRNGNERTEERGTFNGSFIVKDGKLNGKGRIILYDRWSKVDLKGTIKDNKLNGPGEFIYYDENGIKIGEFKGSFKDNKLNGPGVLISYYENGNKKGEHRGTFKEHRLMRGEIIFYYEDGTIKERKKI